MLGFCALVLAHVCVPSQYASALSLRAMYHGPHMDNRNARAHVSQIITGAGVDIFLSDWFQGFPAAKFDKNCAGGVCVFYRRHCTSELACEYEWDIQKDNQAAGGNRETVMHRTLMLKARTPEEMRDLQRNVTFVQAPDEAHNVPVGKLSAAAFTKESPDLDLNKLIDCPTNRYLQGLCGDADPELVARFRGRFAAPAKPPATRP